MTSHEEFKVKIPEGKSRRWEVKRFTVSEEAADIDLFRSMINSHRPVRYCPPGDYTKLICDGEVVMSDTRDECADHMDMIERAKGNVLMNGLGLGMVLQACAEKPEVTHVTVIEISPDVIQLVAPYYCERYGDKIEIIEADALQWKPPKGVRYDVVWHDIWPNICSDNLVEMKKLLKRYRKIADWQGCWGRNLCRRCSSGLFG